MKITIEHYDKSYTVEWINDDVALIKVIQQMCFMLVNMGWQEEQIAEYFGVDDTGKKNDPFEWEIH